MTNNINNINPNQITTSLGKQDKTGSTAQNTSTENTAKTSTDQVKLTNQAQDLQQLEQTIKSLPEVDQARVEKIKAQIASGNYSINPSTIADKIIKNHE